MREKIYYLMMMIAPEIYCKYININKKGETVIYVRALNAIYGTTKAALYLILVQYGGING